MIFSSKSSHIYYPWNRGKLPYRSATSCYWVPHLLLVYSRPLKEGPNIVVETIRLHAGSMALTLTLNAGLTRRMSAGQVQASSRGGAVDSGDHVYTLIVGVGASVVRAVLLGSLAIFGRQYGRRQDGPRCLALVAAILAL
jgi:hypothetical protein